MERLSGVCPTLLTPFDEDESVDFGSIGPEIDFVIAAGADGIVLHGLASEGYKLSEEERLGVLDHVVEALGGRAPVVAGVDHVAPKVAGIMALQAERHGADAIMARPVPGPRGYARDVAAEYFGAIADATALPIVIQDASLGNGVSLSAELIAQVVDRIPSVQYVKVEVPQSATKMRRLRELQPERLTLFGGLGGRYFDQELAAGSSGTIVGPAFVALFASVWRRWRAADRRAAVDEFRRHLPVLVFSEGNDALTALQKALLHRAGVFRTAVVRAPGLAVDPSLVASWLETVDATISSE